MHTYDYRGRVLTRQQISTEFGIPYSTLWNRLALGWSIERAIETPIVKRAPKVPSEAERRAFVEALAAAPQIFAPAERRAVHAVMVEGLSVYQAASDIGAQRNTINVRLESARRALNAWLHREGRSAA